MRIHGLILAAGQSKRLGQAKQLIEYRGRSLLQHIEHTLTPLVDELFVVLGHNHPTLQRQLHSAQAIINEQWLKGLGSSLRCGVKAAQEGADVLLVALCDQPKIPQSHYQALLAQSLAHPRHLVATAHADSAGVPAVFQRSHFTALLQTQCHQGARQLLHSQTFPLITLPCDEAAFDVDWPADIEHL